MITWQFLRKLNIQLPYDPAIPLNIYSKELKERTQRDICTPMLIAASFTKVER